MRPSRPPTTSRGMPVSLERHRPWWRRRRLRRLYPWPSSKSATSRSSPGADGRMSLASTVTPCSDGGRSSPGVELRAGRAGARPWI